MLQKQIVFTLLDNLQFNDIQFLNSMNNFEVISKVGEGAFASVYKVKRKEDAKIYAIKKIKISNAKQREISNALNQVRILASIQNPYIVGYKEAFYEQNSGSLCMVTEFAQGGDLSSMISKHRKKQQYIPEQQIWRLIIQMLHGLKYLHQKNIFHRDIKSANIFLTKNNEQIKLGDMNVSVISKSGMANTQTGTPYYTSPQVWRDMPYNGKCDVWSLGCVLYQMTAFFPPFLAQDINSLKKKVLNGHYQRIPKNYSEDLQSFIRLCLVVNIHDRSSVESLLHCKYIRKRIHLYNNEKFNLQNYGLINNSSKLLETIRTPLNKNFRALHGRLPKSNYQTSDSIGKQNVMRNNSNYMKSERPLENMRSESESRLPKISFRNNQQGRRHKQQHIIRIPVQKPRMQHLR